jgi:hypothetical protein
MRSPDGQPPLEQPPAWAHPLSADLIRTLVATVHQVAHDLGASEVSGPDELGYVTVVVPVGQMRLPLESIVRLVTSAPADQWGAVIRRYFQELTNFRPPRSVAEPRLALRIHILPPDAMRERPDVVSRAMAAGLTAGLVLEPPVGPRAVTAGDLGSWGLSEDEAWRAAEANTRREPVRVSSLSGPDGAELRLLSADHPYVAPQALWLDQHWSCDPVRGAVVGLPACDTVLVHAIHDFHVVAAMNEISGCSQRLYEEEPGSITPEIYWWRPGGLVHIPLTLVGGHPTVTPPAEFVPLLRTLLTP